VPLDLKRRAPSIIDMPISGTAWCAVVLLSHADTHGFRLLNCWHSHAERIFQKGTGSLAQFRNRSSPNGGRKSDRRHYIFGYTLCRWGVGCTVFSASECRAQAQKCMDLAEVVRSTEKRRLLEIAHTWLKLVRQIEISDLATIVEMSSPPLTPTNESRGLKRTKG
jgi:hypothetical protein